MAAMDPVEVARELGARPYLFLALLVGAGLLAVLALVFTVRWADAHARRIWGHAKRAWTRLGARPTMRALEARFPSVWRAMRTLTATEYLLMHLGVGLTALIAALFFIELAGSLAEKQTMVAVDLALASSLHTSASPRGIAVVGFFTMLGGGLGTTVIGVLVALVLIWKRQRLLLVGWVTALSGAGIMNRLLKAAFARSRPVFETPFSVEDGWSFPSGHSMATLVATGMLAYLGFVFVKSPTKRLLFVLAALSWSVAMGFSRMYLGVHYFSDVMAGFAAGTVWLAACITGVEIARRRPAGLGSRVPAV